MTTEQRSSRSKLAALNAAFGIINQIANTITGLILPPLIISYFGSSMNGLLAAIRQILSYAQLYGAGVSTAAMQEMYAPLAVNDHTQIKRMILGVEKAFNKAGFLFSITVLVIAGVYPLFVETKSYFVTMLLVIILGLAGISEFFFIGKYRTILGADQRGYIISIAQSVGAILNTVVGVILLFTTKDIIIVQLGCTIAYIFRIVIPAIYIKSKYGYLAHNRELPDISVIKKRNDVLVQVIMGSITLNSQIVILSLFVSLAQSSVYSVYNTVFYGLYLILSSFTNSITASIGSLMATSNKERIQSFYNMYEGIYFILLFILYTSAAMLLFPFIHLYIGNIQDAKYIDISVAFLFIINGILHTIRVPAVTMINAAGHFKETKMGAVIETIISVVIQLSLVSVLGIYGVLIGTFAALLFRSNQLMIYAKKKIINGSIKKMYSRILFNIIISMLLLLVFFNLFNYPINSWFSWLICGVLLFFANTCIFLMLNAIFEKKIIIEAFNYFKFIVVHKNTTKQS